MDVPLLVHEEVGGFYVAMKHASGVRKLKQVRAADDQAHARALGQLLFIGIAVDGDAADGGGSDIGGAGVRVARVDLAADARLFEKATFVVETCALLGVARSPQNLDRNRQSIPFTFAYPSAAPPSAVFQRGRIQRWCRWWTRRMGALVAELYGRTPPEARQAQGP